MEDSSSTSKRSKDHRTKNENNDGFDNSVSERNQKRTHYTSSRSNNLLTEGIIAGQRIAKISVVTLISIGIVEILTGYYSGSVVATADGIDSVSDAAISFIVLLA